MTPRGHRGLIQWPSARWRRQTGVMDSAVVESFVRDGFVKLPGAVPGGLVDACAGLMWEATGLDPRDPSTWAEPVYWVAGMSQPPFVQAMNSPVVLAACERLAGPGRWKPRDSMGSFPLRFPHDDEPDGLGWHVEGSYMPAGATSWWTNVRSRDRALLALYLFTHVDMDDGPTRIRVGSHLEVPPVLQPYGEQGAAGPTFAAELAAATEHCEVGHATGRAGDVYLCHPFLVHAAQANHGSRPRFLGQPAIPAGHPYRPDRPEAECSPVELTLKQGLRRAGA
jgi:hypothetical protein